MENIVFPCFGLFGVFVILVATLPLCPVYLKKISPALNFPHFTLNGCLVVLSLFRYVDEEALFSRPTFAAFRDVLDNYQRMTGVDEDFSPQQLAEQEAFIRETMSNTELGRELYGFLFTKGTGSRLRLDSQEFALN